MAAPVHSIDWDARDETARISFGPTPEISFGDFLEYLRYLNRREPKWITEEERTSDEFGDELGSSAAGEAVGGIDEPWEVPEPLVGGGTGTGEFFTLITIADGADAGDILLQGGQVTAGSGTETIANILLYDASLDTWTGEPDEYLEMAINGEGEVADDVLMPVFNLDTDGAETSAVAAIADNILPEVGTLAGLCNVMLGQFTASGFTPSGPGHIGVGFCFGGFNVTRF
jgi:hypothetical protein